MEITFNFSSNKNNILGTNNFQDSGSHLMIRCSKKKSFKNKRYYVNHIGPGMPIVVLIQASEDNNFTININEGDDIYYKSIFPPWAINRVEVYF